MGADVSAVDNDGNNVLHLLIAAMNRENREEDIVSIFPFLEDHQQRSPVVGFASVSSFWI